MNHPDRRARLSPEEYEGFVHSQFPNLMQESNRLLSYGASLGAVHASRLTLDREKVAVIADAVSVLSRIKKYGSTQVKRALSVSRDSHQHLIIPQTENAITFFIKKSNLSEHTIERALGAMADTVNSDIDRINRQIAAYQPSHN